MAQTRIVLRNVVDTDLPIFFEHQADRDAARLAAFRSREREAFFRHWATLLAEPANVARTIVVDDLVAGNIGSFPSGEHREVGYWIARELWGRGIASVALAQFLEIERTRPLRAGVAAHNIGSIRVLEKCGFTRIRREENFAIVDGAQVAGWIYELSAAES